MSTEIYYTASLFQRVGFTASSVQPVIKQFYISLTCVYITYTVVPSWILAVVIGVTAASMFHRLGPSVTGSLSYAVTFATYAVMISSGLIVHCLYLVECDAQTPTKVKKYRYSNK